jgi:hypothetical protein
MLQRRPLFSRRFVDSTMPEMNKRATLLLLAVALGAGACATVKPVGTGAPHRDEAPYPVVVTETAPRTEAAGATWAQLSHQSVGPVTSLPPLQPVTATIHSLPNTNGNSFFLPKVGLTSVMNDEETRESLRRFLTEWQKLIGANPQQLSLVQETANAAGTKTAVYEQRPFSYPLRGDFGKVEVQFAADRRVLNLSSTAIPDSERIQTALSAAVARIKSEDTAGKIAGRSGSYTDANGSHSYVIGAGSPGSLQQLVVYARLNSNKSALEFHLAWEIGLADGPIKTVYLDAVEDEVLAVSPSP